MLLFIRYYSSFTIGFNRIRIPPAGRATAGTRGPRRASYILRLFLSQAEPASSFLYCCLYCLISGHVTRGSTRRSGSAFYRHHHWP